MKNCAFRNITAVCSYKGKGYPQSQSICIQCLIDETVNLKEKIRILIHACEFANADIKKRPFVGQDAEVFEVLDNAIKIGEEKRKLKT